MANPTLPNCEWRTSRNGTPCAIVAEHHHVLSAWARLRRESVHPLEVVTLDHHTDVIAAYRERAQAGFEYRSDEALAAAIAALRHDEHLDWAMAAGVIRGCRVIAQENFTVPARPELQVVCDPMWPDSQSLFAGTPAARRALDRALEADFLARQMRDSTWFDAECPVLDIDLDYFLTAHALSPEDASFFQKMVRRAKLITISREEDWVRILRLPGERITAQDIEERLWELIESAASF